MIIFKLYQDLYRLKLKINQNSIKMKKLYCLCITLIVLTLVFHIGPRLFPERKSSLKQKFSISYKDQLKINYESEEEGTKKNNNLEIEFDHSIEDCGD